MPESLSDTAVMFSSSQVPAGELRVRTMRGREGVSSLFQFDFLLETTFGGPLELDVLDGMLAREAYMSFGPSEQHRFHGILSDVELVSMASANGPVNYKVTMVPRMWLCTRTRRSRVFQDQTVPEIVRAVLEEYGIATTSGRAEYRISGRHPKREYVVQYEETDFDFVSRLMEYEGIFYWFEHGDEFECVVFADQNSALPLIPGFDHAGYNPRSGMTDPTESVHSLSRKLSSVAEKTVVRDYNYRTPALSLTGEFQSDEGDNGTRVHYAEHVKDLGDARRIAKIRAEESFVAREVYTGATTIRALRSGYHFELESHPIPSLDQDYMVTEVRHSVSQGMVSGDPGGEGQGAYANEFTAIPYRVAFRPARHTPKPRIHGVMHAKVDASGGSLAAPIDEHGRYKILMPLDSVGASGGLASRWVRMLQTFSGPGYGMHMPLHMGAEVLVAHIDGDPDRPVLLGAVPNPDTVSPVTSANATQSVIRTLAGIRFEFEDDA